MTGFVLCLVVLSLSLVLSTNKLQSMTSRIMKDATAIDLAHQLEIAILSERREDFLWRTTGEDRHLRQEREELERAEQVLAQLKKSVSREVVAQADRIAEDFERYRAASRVRPPTPIEELSYLTDRLLNTVEEFRSWTREQMAQTTAVSETLNRRVDWGAGLISVLTLVMGTIGAFVLVHRIMKPILSLIGMAREFGQGDLTRRAQPHRNDELGVLCNTFNDMAESLETLQRERLSFIAAVAHDLKNPLMVIGATARRLKKRVAPSEDLAGALDRIAERVKALENSIQDLMDSIQIETGSLTFQMEELDLGSFVRNVCQRQAELTKDHRLILDTASRCWIKGDPRKLEKAISNILSNAIKYSHVNSTVILRLRQRAGEVLLLVEDEGAGNTLRGHSNLVQTVQEAPARPGNSGRNWTRPLFRDEDH